MKKVLFIGFAILFFAYYGISQNQIGLKVGLSSYDFKTSNSLSTENIKLSISDASYGFQAGIYGRLGLLGIYIQPEICFNSNTVHYKLEELDKPGTIKEIRTASYRNLDFPVLFMITPAVFNFYAGPVGHYFLNDISDFKEKDKIKEMFKELTYGYQLGGGISLDKFTIDIRYEGSFSKNIKTVSIENQDFKISDSPSRFIFSLMVKI